MHFLFFSLNLCHSGVYVGGEKNWEYFISGQVLDQVSGCEKQAQPGEVYVSNIAWQVVEELGRMTGTLFVLISFISSL